MYTDDEAACGPQLLSTVLMHHHRAYFRRLQVMEVVLDFVMAYLEFLTSKLEATAHPILDSIVHKACMLANQRDRLSVRLRLVACMSHHLITF